MEPKTAPAQETALAIVDPAACNLLLPTQDVVQVAAWHQMRLTRVVIDPDPDKGDVFKVGSRKIRGAKGQETTVDLFTPGKPAILRLAQAAGLGWNWDQHGVVERRPQTGPTRYVRFRAVGLLRLPDGTLLPVPGEYDVDLDAIEQELRMGAEDKADGGLFDSQARDFLASMEQRAATRHRQDGSEYEMRVWFFGDPAARERWIAKQVRPAMIQWLKTCTRRAETGAMLRVVRVALAMRSTYTREELAKPFLVARVEFAPDYSDPAVRAALIQHGVSAMHGLIGQARAMQGPASAPVQALPQGHPQAITGAEAVMAGDDEPEADAPPAITLAEAAEGSDADEDGPAEAAPPDPYAGDPRPRCEECGRPITEVETETTTGRRTVSEVEIFRASKKETGRALCLPCLHVARQARRPKPAVQPPAQQGSLLPKVVDHP